MSDQDTTDQGQGEEEIEIPRMEEKKLKKLVYKVVSGDVFLSPQAPRDPLGTIFMPLLFSMRFRQISGFCGKIWIKLFLEA